MNINVETISRYEYLYVLSALNEIDQGGFNAFKEASGLWIAMHNYEKIKAGPPTVHAPYHPKVHLEICSSCGGAVINGHCKCSD